MSRTPNDAVIFNRAAPFLFQENNLTIFDVGFNKGEWSNSVLGALGTKIKNIHAFEPNEMLYNEARVHPKIRLNNTALFSTKEQNKKLYVPGKIVDNKWVHSAHALASFTHRPIFDTWSDCTLGSQLVATDTIDSYVKENNINKINYLKIDVEGHELDVLKGAGSSLKEGIVSGGQFEYGGCFQDAKVQLRDVVQFLNDNNYNVYDSNIDKTNSGLSTNIVDDYFWCNILFIKRDLLK